MVVGLKLMKVKGKCLRCSKVLAKGEPVLFISGGFRQAYYCKLCGTRFLHGVIDELVEAGENFDTCQQKL